MYSLGDLPEGLRQRLRDLGRGAALPGHAVTALESLVPKVFGVLAGLGLMAGGLALLAFYHYPLNKGDANVRGFVFVVGLTLVFASLLRAVGFLRSEQRPISVQVGGLRIVTGRDREAVYLLPMGGGKGAAIPPEYLGWYQQVTSKPGTKTSASLGGCGAALLCLPLAVLVAVPTVFVAWVINLERVEAHEWELAERRARESAEAAAGAWGGYLNWDEWHARRVPPSVRAFTVIDKHLAQARDNYDDATFAKAKTAKLVREYRRQFPKGRHLEDSKVVLHGIYKEAEQAYLAQAKAAGAKPSAAEGMKALLGFLCESDDPTVRIQFLPVQGIEGGPIEKAARAETGSTKVAAVGPSFTAERNQAREGRIAAAMRQAFLKVFPGDVFDLDPASRKITGPRLLVRYEVKGSGKIYTLKSEDKLPSNERNVYPGIFLAFDFTLQVPTGTVDLEDDATKGFHLSTVAQPAVNFSVKSGSAGAPDATLVYDMMAETAFQKFEVELAKAYGVGAGLAVETPDVPAPPRKP